MSEYMQTILNAFSLLDIETLRIHLKDYDYQDTTKTVFLRALEKVFVNFKNAGDTELNIYEGKCIGKSCPNFGKKGFRFVGNKSKQRYLDLIFEIEGDDIDEVIREAKGNGIKNVVVNRDGSLTYTMSKATHNRITNELKEGFIESLEDMKSGNDFKSIHDVKYDGKLTKFTLTVDKEAFENSFDGFAIFGIGLMSMYYQVYSGVDVDKWSATIEIKDRYSGKVFRTTNYPGDLEGDDDQL